MQKHLNISEIFYSLQGESSYMGTPCIFIRLAGCNLRCSFCDTQYAFGPGRSMAIGDIISQVQAYPCTLVEVTGGEPLFQDEVLELFTELNKAGFTILLETNGSLYLGDVPEYVTKIVDVKTPGSAMGDSFMKWNLKCLNPKDELKFVITNYIDFQFALNFLKTHKPKVNAVYFSPVVSVLEPSTLGQWMLESGCEARLGIQLHKLLQIR